MGEERVSEGIKREDETTAGAWRRAKTLDWEVSNRE